jgi:hypothetical protein
LVYRRYAGVALGSPATLLYDLRLIAFLAGLLAEGDLLSFIDAFVDGVGLREHIGASNGGQEHGNFVVFC